MLKSKEAQCDGKFRFPNRTVADKAASHSKNAHAYRCQHCGGFHVGGKNGRGQRLLGRKA